MGQVYKFQAHSIEDTHTYEPTINYSTSSSGVSSYKNVNGKESLTTSGVMRASTKSPEADVKYNGLSLNPKEAEAFIKEVEGEQEAEAEEQEKQQEEQPSESFDESTTLVLNDMDKGDLSNAINKAMSGTLNEEGLVEAVKSLGFSDRDSALEVANNLHGSLEDKFDRIAHEEGLFSSKDAWTMLTSWSNRAEATKAVSDWMHTNGMDTGRLRESMREAFLAYGRADNQRLIDNLKHMGYDVEKTNSGGIVIKGNGISEWATWREARESFREW
jgi:hypothetical protein